MFRPCGDARTSRTWREDIRAIWRFLGQNYHLGESEYPEHGTRIDIDHLPPLNFREHKRVMQGFLYFDPVLATVMPEAPKGRKCCQGWNGDVPVVPHAESASHAVRAIENAADLAAFNKIIAEITDRLEYRWSFVDLGRTRRKWIHFWYAPTCKTAAEVIEWTEFALSFVESCLACTSAAALLRLPRNKEGLRTFMTRRVNGYEELYGNDVILTTNFHKSERSSYEQ
jgi:hypothetical protein